MTIRMHCGGFPYYSETIACDIHSITTCLTALPTSAPSKARYTDLDIAPTASYLMIATAAELMRCYTSRSFLSIVTNLASKDSGYEGIFSNF